MRILLMVIALSLYASQAQAKGRIQTRPASPSTAKSLVIVPGSPSLGDTPGFFLIQRGVKLFLGFNPGKAGRKEKDGAKLGSQSPFAVEITAPVPVEVEPAILSAGEWDSRKNEMELKISGGAPNNLYRLVVRAVFPLCNAQKKCTAHKSDFQLDFKF